METGKQLASLCLRVPKSTYQLTKEQLISHLFNPHKNESVKMKICGVMEVMCGTVSSQPGLFLSQSVFISAHHSS